MKKIVNKRTSYEIAVEWDNIVEDRQKIIDQGKDISLKFVTSPCILKHIISESPLRVLDAGCGSGYLTSELAKVVDSCVGIDVSVKSISIAKAKDKNISFVNSRIGDFTTDYMFDACISNMALMTDPDWIDSLKNIYNLLSEKGILLITITHPCFWPRYWNYQNEDWFDYKEEIFINNEFSTSLASGIGQTTHIHRPIASYFNELISIGFVIELVEEPYPVAQTPEGYTYDYPRFLFIKCRKRIN